MSIIESKIIEGNKLILQSPFALNLHKQWMGKALADGTMDKLFTVLQYHTSWNWIMPVIEKIKIIYPQWDGFIDIELYSLVEAVKTVNKETIWQSVVQFIQWHNQKKEESK